MKATNNNYIIMKRATLFFLCFFMYIPLMAQLSGDMYIIKNVASGLYWGAGNNWGTQASLMEHPSYVTLNPQDDGTYYMETQVNNGGDSYYFSGDYMDSSTPVALTITQVDFDKYTIANGDDYYGWDGSTTVLGKNLSANSENALWEIVSYDDAVAALSQASAANPLDATFLIMAPDFGRNNIHLYMWDISGVNQLSGGNNINNCAESYHKNFSLSQTIANAPAGYYTLTAQGFYRQDGSNETNLPVFFANDETQVFPVRTGTENSMSDASVSFSNGLYTISPINVEVTEEGQLTVGAKLENNPYLWCIWDNFVLTYYGKDSSTSLSTAIATYNETMNSAKKAAADDVVTGIEKDALIQSINDNSNIDMTSVEEIKSATASLKSALSTFNSAKSCYVTLAEAKKYGIPELAYASAAKRSELEMAMISIATSAEDALEKSEILMVALRAYYESHAMAEGVEGATDMTSYIQNPNAENGNSNWTTSGSMNSPMSSEPWTSSDGDTYHYYFDGGSWGSSSWTTTMSQQVSVPAGKYLLTAKGRASANVTLTMSVGNDSVYLPHVGNTGNVFDRGWNDGSIEFETSGLPITILITASANAIHQWFSVSDFRLICLEHTQESLSTAIEHYNETMNAAKEAAADDLVTGIEKTALIQSIDDNSDIDMTSVEIINAATVSLESALTTFNNAKSSYMTLAEAKMYGIPELAYASAAKRSTLETAMSSIATSASEALEISETIMVALRAYYESHAMAEGVEGATDMTSYIQNPNAEDGNNYWNRSGSMNSPMSSEPWTSSDGNTYHYYFDGGNYGSSSWTTTMSQQISVPAGKYLLTAKGRASANVTLTMSVGKDSLNLPHVGNTGNVFDRGWNDGSIEFETSGLPITILITASANAIYQWFSVSDFRLICLEYNQESINTAIELYNDAMNAAKEAAADDIVTGIEKTALIQSINDNSDIDMTSVEIINAATLSLESAINTYNDAKSCYITLAETKMYGIPKLAYASATKRSNLETAMSSIATSASDALEKSDAIMVALRAYYESHAMAEGVEGAIDMTSSIQNPSAENGNSYWTTSGPINYPLNSQPWTSSDGDTYHYYFDGGSWDLSSWMTTMSQQVTVPAGRYLLTAKGRSSSNVTLTMAVGGATVDLPNQGSTGNVFNNGWNDGSVEFETSESPITILITASANAIHEWFSVSDFRLICFEELVTDTVTISNDGRQITLSTSTPDAVIYYTIDGTTPTTESSIYTEPIMLENSCTVKAFAQRQGYKPSKQTSFTFLRTKYRVAKPTVTNDNHTLTISTTTEDARIYYTLDGSTPTEESTLYEAPIICTHYCIVKAIGVRNNWFNSLVTTYELLDFKADSVVISNNGRLITLSTPTANAVIYYTLDGSTPTEESTVYTKPIELEKSCTLKAIAVAEGYTFSDVTTFDFNAEDYTVATPKFMREGNSLEISTTTDFATLFYTLDGSMPTEKSSLYNGPITLTKNCTVKAFGIRDNWFNSSVDSIIVNDFKTAPPSFTLESDDKLSIKCNDLGATIHYSFNSSDSKEDFKLYTGTLTLADNRPIRAYASFEGWNDSEIVTFTPDRLGCLDVSFTYDGHYIRLSSNEGATIHYTLNGSTPTSDSPTYDAPVDANGLCTVKAIAMKTWLNNSSITSMEVKCYYDGIANVQLSAAGNLSNAFEWCGTDNVPTLKVTGPVNASDVDVIRNIKTLQHLSLQEATIQGNELKDGAFSGMNLVSIYLPEGLSSVGANLFKDCNHLAAIVWNSMVDIPANALTNINNPNLLLYVPALAIATKTNIKNVVANGTATKVVLIDAEENVNNNFYCPIAFTAKDISYTHKYGMKTGINRESRGWETLALPFNVATIKHETNGQLVPFAKNDNSKKPFWLLTIDNNNFKPASSIEANKPYAISMPNNEEYGDEYNMPGNVVFSATNTQVPVTNPVSIVRGNTKLTANFQRIAKSDSILTVNEYEAFSDTYPEGSIFLRDNRSARPFEAYATLSHSSVRFIPIFDEYTPNGILDVSILRNNSSEYYNLQGVRLAKPKKGFNIVNGKKVVIR